jgi:hypothetical protein
VWVDVFSYRWFFGLVFYQLSEYILEFFVSRLWGCALWFVLLLVQSCCLGWLYGRHEKTIMSSNGFAGSLSDKLDKIQALSAEPLQHSHSAMHGKRASVPHTDWGPTVHQCICASVNLVGLLHFASFFFDRLWRYSKYSDYDVNLLITGKSVCQPM